MSRRIYSVRYEVKTSDCRDWFEDDRTVLGSDDALTVVAKVRRWAKPFYERPYKDTETGETIQPKFLGFRLTAITVVAEADLA